jgi:chromosome segregation ATPase
MAYDASIRSEQEFERDNNALIIQRDQAQQAFDEADSTKTSLVSQIEVLNELLYTVTNPTIIEAINEKIVEFEGEITEAEAIIEEAQIAFNGIAEETILVVSKRQEELAEIEKVQRFTDAKSHYANLQSEISDYQNRLQYFDEDQAAADDTKEKVRSCEPALLYELDTAGIPQVSQEAVDIINAIAARIINPETFNPTVALPSNIETKPTELMKLFQLNGPPPGFEGI